MENKDNLLVGLGILFRHRKFILMITGIVFVGSIVIALLLPVYYKSSTIFYAASPDLSNPDKMFGGGSGESQYYGTNDDVDRLLTIAQGNELLSYLIKEFDLYEHYNVDSTSPKSSFYIKEKLLGLYNVQKTKYDAIQLSVEDKDPKQAAAMANAARDKISFIAKNLVKSSQKQQMDTYKSSISESSAKLNILGDSLAGLRERFGIYNPETQGEILATMLATAQGKVSALQGKLDALVEASGTPRDTIRRVSANLKGAEAQLTQVKADVEKFNQGSSRVSALTEEHENAKKQISWDNERLKHWEAAYNAAYPVIHLVETASIPLVKSRPMRTIIVLASTFVAFLFAVIGALLFEQYGNVNWKKVMQESDNGSIKKSSREILQNN
jgi:tyrosine-protein kinase Etk/Wzc